MGQYQPKLNPFTHAIPLPSPVVSKNVQATCEPPPALVTTSAALPSISKVPRKKVAASDKERVPSGAREGMEEGFMLRRREVDLEESFVFEGAVGILERSSKSIG